MCNELSPAMVILKKETGTVKITVFIRAFAGESAKARANERVKVYLHAKRMQAHLQILGGLLKTFRCYYRLFSQ